MPPSIPCTATEPITPTGYRVEITLQTDTPRKRQVKEAIYSDFRRSEPLPLSFDHNRAIDRLDRHNRSYCIEINP